MPRAVRHPAPFGISRSSASRAVGHFALLRAVPPFPSLSFTGLMPSFLICLHDVSPAFSRETRAIVEDLRPLVGTRISLGIVPNWAGQWHLTAHPEFSRFVRESAEERLLHGYFHRRQRGWGPVTWLAERSDEMNGLDVEETRQTIERGQQVFTEVFGEPARGFLAPAWQPGHVRPLGASAPGLDHFVGFFSAESSAGVCVPLATWTWDCGRWGWLGHVGHGVGSLFQSIGTRVPALAIHPRDLERGYWPKVLRLTQQLLDRGFEPTTVTRLLAVRPSEASRRMTGHESAV